MAAASTICSRAKHLLLSALLVAATVALQLPPATGNKATAAARVIVRLHAAPAAMDLAGRRGLKSAGAPLTWKVLPACLVALFVSRLCPGSEVLRLCKDHLWCCCMQLAALVVCVFSPEVHMSVCCEWCVQALWKRPSGRNTTACYKQWRRWVTELTCSTSLQR
jgi:hypothetical protein